MCLLAAQLPNMEQLADELRISMGLLELFHFTRNVCLTCHMPRAGVIACLHRVEGGANQRGSHIVAWGGNFRRFVLDLQMNDAVLKVTGLPLESNNMIMLHMSQRATEQSMRQLMATTNSLRRETDALRRDRDRMRWASERAGLLQNENDRMFFVIQRAYRAGLISADVMHQVIFGGAALATA
jgi:hypothetical protein